MMRKAFYALAMVLGMTVAAQAAPGDTTWVQAHSNIQLGHYGAYDTAVAFPSGSTGYRKVYMVFTLGTYSCPTGAQYCHQWDYDVHGVLMTPGGDTMEIARFITPYGNTGVPSFPTNWKYRYIFDVTDYYTLLKGNAALRIFYSGYSWGFTGDVRFAFVEGTPERNVLGVSKLWSGSYTFGKASDPIDNHVTAITRTAPAGTQSAEMKMLITGHGGDPTSNCCEFASHMYDLKVNSTSLGTTRIWRDNCGSNELYPQGGTWIYERANWCPGALVEVKNHKLTGVTAGNAYTTDIDFDAYTNTANNNFGAYNIESNVVYYGAYNKTADASVEDIIAPSDFEGHFRENPSDGKPVILLRNTGSSTITSMQIAYGVKDSAVSTYNWTGSLAPLAQTQITLPELAALKSMSLAGATGSYRFMARIAQVNGTADNDVHNDTLRSTFTVAPTWPNSFVVYMKTNSAGTGGVGSGTSESGWKITDAAGNTVASRTNASLSTVYTDTVTLPQTGFYKLSVTDGSCDGLHWWVWDQNPNYGITGGNIAIRNGTNGINIPVRGNTYSGTYHDDFGCGFEQSFTVVGAPTGVPHIAGANTATIVAYPNPAKSTVNVALYGLGAIRGEIRLTDAVGRTVLAQPTTSANNAISVESLSSGLYNIIYKDEAGAKAVSRITITK